MTTDETMPDVIYAMLQTPEDPGPLWDTTDFWGGTKYLRADTVSAAVREAEDYADMIRLLLPLAKGYVHANPGIRSTECIIEDAEDMLEQTNTALAALLGLGEK